MKKNRQGAFIKNIVSRALPWYVARRLPPREMLLAWPDMVGEYLAQRAGPVCLQSDGLLIVAARGAALRQELTLSAAELTDKLVSCGFAVSGIKIITSRPPARPTLAAQPARPELAPLEKSGLLEQAAQVKNPALRQALLELLGAQKES